MGDIVYNATGTSGRKCQCNGYSDKSWLAHWERMTNQNLPAKCCAKGCGDYVAVGAHILHTDDLRQIWIVPFCQWHNKRPSTVPIELKWGVMLGRASTTYCL
jgi:hypothetical protein